MRVYLIPTQRGQCRAHDVMQNLCSLQSLVGGFIETVSLPQLIERKILLVVNEEGVLRGLPVNENLWPFFFVGQCFMVGVDGEDFVSLTDEQIAFIQAWLQGLT